MSTAVHFCPCKNPSGHCYSRTILPPICPLGEYERLASPPGVYEYGRRYERASGKWPLEVVCFDCRYRDVHDAPASRIEDREVLVKELRQRSLWSVEILDGDPRYADCRLSLFYTTAPASATKPEGAYSPTERLEAIKQEFADFANLVRPTLKAYDPATGDQIVIRAGQIVPQEFDYRLLI
jgi:hypothetical protein